jgi:hypothetical protein
LITEAPEYQPVAKMDGQTVADRTMLQRIVVALALALLLVGIWSLTHHYRGLTGDAELYAVQALAKLNPALANDLYLQTDSQDRYTIFSPVYAAIISVWGLQQAALALYVTFTVWFLAAAWSLARTLSTPDTAWASVALLVITIGRYGAYDVFHISEEFLTARTIAEALIATALACHFRGSRRLGFAIAAAALFVHPLMALPGLLLLVCLWLPMRVAIGGAAAGIGAALIITAAALLAPQPAHLLTLIDGAWLEVVRERSQFLFLQLWRVADWKFNARPFATLAFTAWAVRDERIRKLCWAAMLVGATGLVLALIASTIGPVAILMQGQAWRWVWIPGFVGVLLLAPTLIGIWRDAKCGPVCAILLVCAWTFTAVDSLACIGLALLLWSIRPYITDNAAIYLRWAAVALGVVIVGWTIGNAWTIATAPSPDSGRESLGLARARNILGLQTSAIMLFGFFWWWVRTRRSAWIPALVCVPLAASAAATLPGSFKQLWSVGTPAEIAEFADWRDTIPANNSVFIVGVHKSASFAWFTLQRASYLSVDQSAGVIFSRATALEVQRRSDVLAPLLVPDWRILTSLAKKAAGKPGDSSKPPSLTAATLIGVCRDPPLDFVIAQEYVGFDPVRHDHVGQFKDWYLYDCRHVRALGPPA